MRKRPNLLKRLFIKIRPGLTNEERENLLYGFPKDFELPYPYPRNEHEDGMNWVAVNGVMSGRADW
jgi:hypothetical protein